MAQDPKLAVGPAGHSATDGRLNELWHNARYREFWQVVQATLLPNIHAALFRRYRRSGLSAGDCEVCTDRVVERLIQMQHRGEHRRIALPEHYLRRGAQNAARTMLRQRQRGPAAAMKAEQNSRLAWALRNRQVGRIGKHDPTLIDVSVDKQTAVSIVEGLLEDIEADEGWVTPVVTEAVSRLRPALRAAAMCILTYGPKITAEEGAQLAGFPKPSTFRANKANAYREMRRIIKEILAEKGITPRRAFVEAIFDEPRSGIGEDD